MTTDVIRYTAKHFRVQRAHIMRLTRLARLNPSEANRGALAEARGQYAADLLEQSIREHLLNWPELARPDRERLAHLLAGDEP